MMRGRPALDDIDDETTQTTLNDFVDNEADEECGTRKTPCIAINNHVGPSASVWSGDLLVDETGKSTSYAPWNETASSLDGQESMVSYCSPTVSVRMSVWQELCAGHAADQHQNWTDDAALWRRYAYADECSKSAPSSTMEEAEDAESSALTDLEREHEHRRTLERFASFPTGRSAALGGSGGGGTPKSNRRRNKRKGCDSPRHVNEEREPKSPTIQFAPEEDPDSVLSAKDSDGQGHDKQQLLFDLMELQHDDGSFSCDSEPVTSQAMRPAGGWASLDILPDEEDEDVTVSPRVLSPEMDEPAGSCSMRRFGRWPNECDERRTTFIALGSLSGRGERTNRVYTEADEHPGALRAKQLIFQINNLKDRVKIYEDTFEARHGYRPSHHQKMDDRNTKRLLAELARCRKELKQLKERYHLTEPSDLTFQLADPDRTKDPFNVNNDTTDRVAEPSCVSVEQTVLEVKEHLASNRQLAGRSDAVEMMTTKELLDEKLAVQHALLYVESIHGRPASYRHKDLLRPLYNRYRLLKRMVVRSGLSRSKEEAHYDLAPILEYETLELSETRPGSLHRHSAPPTPSLESMEEMSGTPITPRPSIARRHLTTPITGTDLRTESCLAWKGDVDLLPVSPSIGGKRHKMISLRIEENLHALPLNQLVEQMRHVREEKRRLRRAIRDLEADMLRHQGNSRHPTSISSDEEDVHLELEPVYTQYRHARAKLRLLEALVAKHDGSATL